DRPRSTWTDRRVHSAVRRRRCPRPGERNTPGPVPWPTGSWSSDWETDPRPFHDRSPGGSTRRATVCRRRAGRRRPPARWSPPTGETGRRSYGHLQLLVRLDRDSQFDHEPGAGSTVGAVLDPHVTTLQAHVLGNQ